MKIVTFSHKDKSARLGILSDDSVISIPWIGGMLSFIQSGISPTRTSERFPVAECRFYAPLRPGKLIGVGRNYADHISELGNEVPQAPLLFSKFTSSVTGHGSAITWRSSLTAQVDWEGELAVVIGRRAANVSEADAQQYIFGYTIANDVSARDLQEREPQWARAKGLDTFCPLGPVIATRNDIPDPQALTIETRLNGELVQNGSTHDMIYPVNRLVAYCSQSFVLEAGDIILTGTPSGVGKGMNPPRFLADGDEVSITIGSIGTLTNVCKVITD